MQGDAELVLVRTTSHEHGTERPFFIQDEGRERGMLEGLVSARRRNIVTHPIDELERSSAAFPDAQRARAICAHGHDRPQHRVPLDEPRDHLGHARNIEGSAQHEPHRHVVGRPRADLLHEPERVLPLAQR
jgi:hypothetical protein